MIESPVNIDPPQNPATGMIAGLLRQLIREVQHVWQVLEHTEGETLGFWRITPIGSPAGEGVRRADPNLRCTRWLLSVSAAGTYGVQIGTSVKLTVQVAAAGFFDIPFPVNIQHGSAVTTTGTAAQVIDSQLVAYSN